MRVTFELGSAEMTEQAEAEASVFVKALQAPALAGSRFEVAGHTDSQGNRAYNIDLSRRRAQAVVDFLVAQGADGSRLVASGYGFDRPLRGTSPSAPANRRVEFSRSN
jgi:outer membrane protein OmpA-like peptidoglycan-associated protein